MIPVPTLQRRSALRFALAGRPRRLGLAIGAFLAILTICAYLAVSLLVHRDHIYPSVSVNGVPVGGLTRTEAAARLDACFPGYAKEPLILFMAQRLWSSTPAELGLRTDVANLAEEAFRIGRDGSILERLVAPITLREKTTVQATPTLMPEARDALLRRLATDINRPPVDAHLAITQAGVILEEASPGQRLVRELTACRLNTAIERVSTEPIEVAVELLPAAVQSVDLQAAVERAQVVLDREGLVRFEGHTYRVNPAIVRRALHFAGSGNQTQVDLDEQLIQSALAPIADSVDRPARDASLTVVDGRVQFDAGQSARWNDSASSSPGARRKNRELISGGL